jgi:thioredoxin reductase/ferredoxin
MNLIARYTRWLHTRWPAGTVERLPAVAPDGTTAVPGLRVVGDLAGVPLLKFAADTGARAVQAILAEPGFQAARSGGSTAGDAPLDLAIIGGGVAGIAAAIEARNAGLRFEVYESSQPFSTIVNFPKGKPIFTYPARMTPAGGLTLQADVKEDLVAELEAQRRAAGIEPVARFITHVARRGDVLVLHHAEGEVRARRVIVAIGRSGNFRKLGVAGESLDKVYNRLHDPADYEGANVLVVGGGDSALEASIALAMAGAHVTHSYRRAEFSRPKPENAAQFERLVAGGPPGEGVERPSSERVTSGFTSAMAHPAQRGSIRPAMPSDVMEIREADVVLKSADGSPATIPNDAVFLMIGREPPLDFFRRSGVAIRGEWHARTWLGFAAFLLFCVLLYHWKSNPRELPLGSWFAQRGWFPFGVGSWFDALGGWLAAASQRSTHLLYTLRHSMSDPSFYYTLAYCLCVVVFGVRRIRRRRTPYVALQTYTLMVIQCVPLFVLPQIVLPWMGRNGLFDSGVLGWIGTQLFPNGEYWRAYGLILAWPLFVYNVFTEQPLWAWLAISFVQTFVLIPLIIRYWGKGAYCGWICSCGALAETLGDAQREKMPHGPFWNRLNMVGQGILAAAMLLFVMRALGWVWPGSPFGAAFAWMFERLPVVNYKWMVDVMLAGVIGVGCYFWLSGRVWCRFACPLAALMHIYARFSRFRIFADKKKCISCNVCTSICHQGIDVMNFANKGLPMEDPQCVRCSACVGACPTGVLSFGRYTAKGDIRLDILPASRVQMAEGRGGG